MDFSSNFLSAQCWCPTENEHWRTEDLHSGAGKRDNRSVNGVKLNNHGNCNRSVFFLLGLGFNIVGGNDKPYILGDFGIFISSIKPDGVASRDGRMKVGDRIVAVNDIDITNVPHDSAVATFRSAKGRVKLEVEYEAERRILEVSFLKEGTLTKLNVIFRIPLETVKNSGRFTLQTTSIEQHCQYISQSCCGGKNPHVDQSWSDTGLQGNRGGYEQRSQENSNIVRDN